jgi:hypothetical protein
LKASVLQCFSTLPNAGRSFVSVILYGKFIFCAFRIFFFL